MRLSPFASSFMFIATFVKASHYRDIPYKIKENIHAPPPGWVINSPAPSDHLLQLKIGLPQPHFSILEQHLWEVSDPDHERYGAHLSREETDALMAPHPEALDAVTAWLSSYGIKEEDLHQSSAQDWITIRVPVALAEDMLDTKYYVYTHTDGGENIVRTTKYSLPENLDKHVELIQPTTMFTRRKPLESTLHWSIKRSHDPSESASDTIVGPAGNPVDASCRTNITIICIRQIYNAVGYSTSATNHNKIAVTGFLNEYINDEDLQQFFQWQNLAANGSSYTFVSINGGQNNQSDEATRGEVSITSQVAFGLTYPTSAIFYSTGGLGPFIPDAFIQTSSNEPFLEWLDYLRSQEDLPQVISSSFTDHEQTVPYSYATRVCSEFGALGTRGVSVFFPSGDAGVGGSPFHPAPKQCFTNDGTNRATFIPTFPASCPYVTAVGATVSIPETAANFSGGGFSRYFNRPNYQGVAVPRYLGKLAPGIYDGLYNPDGRGIPDISAQGFGFHVIFKDNIVQRRGTSLAVPVIAGLVSMLNDARINAGKNPFGFMNTWLYTRGLAGLNDITVGNITGCGTDGFNATAGWDPASGLGTFNFEKLLALAVGNHY